MTHEAKALEHNARLAWALGGGHEVARHDQNVVAFKGTEPGQALRWNCTALASVAPMMRSRWYDRLPSTCQLWSVILRGKRYVLIVECLPGQPGVIDTVWSDDAKWAQAMLGLPLRRIVAAADRGLRVA